MVLDEVHYLQDPYRGSVWEEVIILTPPEVVLVCLSATVSNAGELGAWLESVRGPTDVVRGDGTGRSSCATTWPWPRRAPGGSTSLPLLHDGQLHPQAAALDQRVARLARRPGGLRHSRLANPRRSELIEALGRPGHVAGHRLHLLAGPPATTPWRSAWPTGCV